MLWIRSVPPKIDIKTLSLLSKITKMRLLDCKTRIIDECRHGTLVQLHVLVNLSDDTVRNMLSKHGIVCLTKQQIKMGWDGVDGVDR